MALSTAELDYMIEQSPDVVAVTYGAQSCNGLLDSDTAELNAEGGFTLTVDDHVLTIRAAALTSLTMDSSITVAGTEYKIRDIGRALTDGTRRLVLVEA